MKGFFVLSVLCAVAISAHGSTFQLQRPAGDLVESSYSGPDDVQEASLDVPIHHGNRNKRSPVDPIVAPLLIGKSFLYGALIGPKLFHRHHYRPHYHHYGHGHYGHGGYGHGYGHGHYGGGYGHHYGHGYGYGR